MSALQYMVSVDGKDAPSRIHNTVGEARDHAERLAKLPENINSVIRVLMVVRTLRTSSSENYWEE